MRILVTGPECTGKSTLCRLLSTELNIPWFPEYARTYLQDKTSYAYHDIGKIGEEHMRMYNTFPLDQPMILDTYLYNLKVWSYFKFGKCDPRILDGLENIEKFDQVLLLYPDLPWVQDGLRENPDDRTALFDIFRSELESSGQSYEIIKGLGNQRKKTGLCGNIKLLIHLQLGRLSLFIT